ncbi:hypothetical protein H696_00858 [Fonticula alba]|uniref:Uncharacterized protein n=1 Tax=Fonticula alba TaxID=691883 RepID=A0A058ZIH2_FONAL|nr:hypothetical protein H696_00858 [Fonticula alba]KCV73317.1 hypothetical protein H696_00858 [Fonticula alba]|eukprot:XP_009493018.1 hypothetical protein H696_00858 [Fonticula alba]
MPWLASSGMTTASCGSLSSSRMTAWLAMASTTSPRPRSMTTKSALLLPLDPFWPSSPACWHLALLRNCPSDSSVNELTPRPCPQPGGTGTRGRGRDLPSSNPPLEAATSQRMLPVSFFSLRFPLPDLRPVTLCHLCLIDRMCACAPHP